jgi:chitinase
MYLPPTILITLSSFWSITAASVSASPFDSCPIPCSGVSNDPTKWTHFHGVPALERCQEPVLFDTSIFAPVDDPITQITLRSCTASEKNTTHEMEYTPAPFTFGLPIQRRQLNQSTILNGKSANATTSYVEFAVTPTGCNNNAQGVQNQTSIHVLRFRYGRDGILADRSDVSIAIQKLRDYLHGESDCHSTTMLAHFRSAVVGLYVGAGVLNADADTVVAKLVEAVENTSEVSAMASEVCRENTPASWTVGVYADFRGNISATQAALGSWVKGNCVTDYESKDIGSSVAINFIQRIAIPQETSLLTGFEQISQPNSQHKRHVHAHIVPRATCKYLKVESGDTCYSLAQECGISQTAIVNYNTKSNFCNGLKPDDYICCSKGDLPDFTPKPSSDGSCATYQIVANDNCYDIAKKHYLTSTQISDFNKKTWGWAGCQQIQPGQKICLSKGDAPMPASVENALCGPTVPGTLRPTNGMDIKDLNPCPLNVCCNVWGQCGLTNDFCVEVSSVPNSYT